ncbi:MAG TPA: MgtC/SapB family protein [Candidatus Paceibacterota bacterium]|nr:MgtC/SapB family protein [Candidatus Paceibacterota bacterium]
MNPAQFIDPTYIMFAKLILALFLGGAIGTERAVMARQAAGTRTFGLVALGACLLIITANYTNTAYLGIVNFDPMRVAAGIVMGIGFISGGVIIFRGDSLHGVTTAAGLWIAAALGIAVGFGMYSIAIFTTILTLLVFTGMWYLENRFKHWFEDRGANATNPDASVKAPQSDPHP